MVRRLLIAFGLLFIAGAMLLYRIFSGVHAEHQHFEAAAWKSLRDSAELNDPGCVRGGMAIDLVNSGVLIGLSRMELLMKLGDASESKPDLISFALGQCHWDWKHSELAVLIDPSSRVTKVEIRVTHFEGVTPRPNPPLQRDASPASRLRAPELAR